MKSTAHKCHDLFESGQQRSVVLANAGAQETPVILHAYLTACQKVCNRRNRFCAATGARTNCQDQIAERKSGARFDNLAKFAVPFHILFIFALSKSNATSRCEYFFHRHSLVIQFLSTLELTAERHFCSILKHKLNANASMSGACRSPIWNSRGRLVLIASAVYLFWRSFNYFAFYPSDLPPPGKEW